jgi:hypothetical protein
MHNSVPIPTSLKVVAILFVLGGAFSLVEVVVSLMHGNVNMNFGVLGLFIGPGLLRLRRGWRTCALVFLWIGIIGAPIVAVIFITTSRPLDLAIFDHKVGHASKEFGIAIAALLFGLAVWQYRVLTRPDVCALFGGPGTVQPTGAGTPVSRSGSGKLVVGAILAAVLVYALNEGFVKWRIEHRHPSKESSVSGYTEDGVLRHNECRIWAMDDGELFYAIAVSNVDFEPNMPEFSFKYTWYLDDGGHLIVNGARIQYTRPKRLLALNPFGEMQEIELNDAETQIVTSDSKNIWDSVALPRLYHFTGETENGRRVGTWTCCDADGKKAHEGDNAVGKRNGEWTYFYPSGSIRAVIHYQNGKRHGKWTYFTEDGNQLSALTWNDDKPVERAARQIGLDYGDIVYPNGHSPSWEGSHGSTLPDRGHKTSGQPDTLPYRER